MILHKMELGSRICASYSNIHPKIQYNCQRNIKIIHFIRENINPSYTLTFFLFPVTFISVLFCFPTLKSTVVMEALPSSAMCVEANPTTHNLFENYIKYNEDVYQHNRYNNSSKWPKNSTYANVFVSKKFHSYKIY